MAAEDRRQGVSRDAWALGIVLAIGAVLRGLLMLGSSGILWPDSYLFLLSAQEILAGDPFAHDAHKTPLYSLLLAGCMSIGQTPVIGTLLIAFQHALGLCATAIVYRIARQIAGTPVAFVGSLLFTAHTLLLFYEQSVLSEILFVFVLSLLLHQSLRLLSDAQPSAWWWRPAIVGALGGMCTLTRPVAQGFVLVIIALLLIAGRASRRTIAAALIVGAVYAAAVVPWMFVNSRTYGFWGISLGRGLGLFIRVFDVDELEPIANTRYPLVRNVLAWARAHTHNVPYAVHDELNHVHGYSSSQADALMFAFAAETVRAQPWTYARNSARNWRDQLLVERVDAEICRGRGGPYLCTTRGLNMTNAMFPNVPPPGRRTLKRRIASYFTTAYIRMWIVVPLAIVGMVWALVASARSAAAAGTAAVVLLIAAIVYFTGVPALIQWPEERYRLPIDALLFLFAASAAIGIVSAARDGVRRLHPHGTRTPRASAA